MKIAITGESGFIGQNLINSIESFGHEFISLNNSEFFDKRLEKTNEPCVYSNNAVVWRDALRELQVDILIHNAAIVGTDVVALNSTKSTLTNISGTYNLCAVANSLNIPIVYIGTTVIYDTKKYQNELIYENSDLSPITLYGCQKLTSEYIIKSHLKQWLIIRPLFAYGGVGDMNSLPAKIFYGAKNNTAVDMFLNPHRIKDYLHVKDFCDAVIVASQSNVRNDDFNVAAETPQMTIDIVNMMNEVYKSYGNNLTKLEKTHILDYISWYSQTDYLGNHRLSSEKFRKMFDWKPKITLRKGLKMSAESILSDTSNYNPLVHLEEAKSKNIDLTKFFNSENKNEI